jgi:hypothetical protein
MERERFVWPAQVGWLRCNQEQSLRQRTGYAKELNTPQSHVRRIWCWLIDAIPVM